MGWRFCIAGFRFEIACEDHSLSSIADDWRDFRTGEAPEVEIQLEFTGPLRRDPNWQPFLPEVRRASDGGLEVAGDGFLAEVRADRRVARVKQPPERFPVEAVVRVLLADWLLAREGLLLHSVGIAASNRAGVFVGESGAGKTTLGAICLDAGMVRLSDELVAVAPASGRYVAFGTPWNVGRSARAELTMLGVLAHASGAVLEAQPEGALMRTLLPNALMPDPSPSGRSRMFRCASKVIGRVRPVRLKFAKEPAVAAVLTRALSDESLSPRAPRSDG